MCAGLGVFATQDATEGATLGEYCGRTLIGDQAHSLSSMAERQIVWEDARHELGDVDTDTAQHDLSDADEQHAVTMREDYRKLTGGVDLFSQNPQSVLIFGRWNNSAPPWASGAIINDGAALLLPPPSLASLTARHELGDTVGARHELDSSESATLNVATAVRQYQHDSRDAANVAVLPRGTGLFIVATRNISAGKLFCQSFHRTSHQVHPIEHPITCR